MKHATPRHPATTMSSSSSSSISYKDEHQAFVSNLKGTSVGCIFVCLAHAPAFILLLKLVQYNRRQRILRDFIFLVIPVLLNMTILADQCYWSLPIMVASELYFFVRKEKRSTTTSSLHSNIDSSVDSPSDRKIYLTLFKGNKNLFSE